MPAGWVTVKVSVDRPPTAIVVGLNALVSTGVAAVTVTHWLVTLLVMPAVPVTLAAALVLLACGQAPTVGAAAVVTSTVRVQVAVEAIVVLLVKVMPVVPATAMRLPPAIKQVPPTVLGVAMTKPAGSVSV